MWCGSGSFAQIFRQIFGWWRILLFIQNASSNAKQGAIVKSLAGKQRITIRIDTSILDWFRDQVHQSGGGSYQILINNKLKEYIQEREGILEKTIRKVIREELHVAERL